jgi:hypothetical protein
VKKAGLLGAIARLRLMERVAYADWDEAVKEQEAPIVCRAKERIYLDAHKALRITEKDMPGILESRGESIPIETVLAEQGRIDMAVKTELLGLPRKVAPSLVGMTEPADVEELLTAAIDECLRHIASGDPVPDGTA